MCICMCMCTSNGAVMPAGARPGPASSPWRCCVAGRGRARPSGQPGAVYAVVQMQHTHVCVYLKQGRAAGKVRAQGSIVAVTMPCSRKWPCWPLPARVRRRQRRDEEMGRAIPSGRLDAVYAVVRMPHDVAVLACRTTRPAREPAWRAVAYLSAWPPS